MLRKWYWTFSGLYFIDHTVIKNLRKEWTRKRHLKNQQETHARVTICISCLLRSFLHFGGHTFYSSFLCRRSLGSSCNLLGGGRLHDKPKERLRRRLLLEPLIAFVFPFGETLEGIRSFDFRWGGALISCHVSDLNLIGTLWTDIISILSNCYSYICKLFATSFL